jgi:DNA-directed RNA polymerase subunit M/transcription elongation factor TFIIS
MRTGGETAGPGARSPKTHIAENGRKKMPELQAIIPRETYPNACPHCRSQKFHETTKHLHFKDKEQCTRLRCYECKREWDEVHKFVGIRVISK